MAGKLWEDWQVGETLAHEIRRTVTETDNLLWSTMTHNPQPLHLDIEAAQASEFGRILVNGTFTFSLMVGLSVGDTTLGVLVANLGYDKLVMPKPVFLGDTLRAVHGGDRAAREQVAADRGARHVQAPDAQPARTSWSANACAPRSSSVDPPPDRFKAAPVRRIGGARRQPDQQVHLCPEHDPGAGLWTTAVPP